MVAYTKPQPGKKEENERLREERGQIKFIDTHSQEILAVTKIAKH